MSWKDAKQEADRWLQSLNLGPIRNQYIDLHEKGATLKHQGDFRAMILEAAKRSLKARGASSVWLPE